MIGVIKDRVEAFLGRGRYSLAVPAMDGPLQPNRALDEAPSLHQIADVDHLLTMGDTLLCASGPALMKLGADEPPAELARFDAAVSCLAWDGQDGLAVGVAGAGLVIRGGRHDGRQIADLQGESLVCATAAIFVDADTLIVAQGSSRHAPSAWTHDLMSAGAHGSVWKVSLATGQAEPWARGLAWPAGLVMGTDGEVWVSEAWRHRLIALRGPGATPRVVLADLPGYPGRLVSAAQGGFWLTVFAPRNQLVEFVLQEREFRERMMQTIEPRLWIAPSLGRTASLSDSLKTPIQQGTLKQMGMVKPWAPSLSYGLVVKLGPEGLPQSSLHSRADGRRHGVTSLCERGQQLFVGAQGSDEVLTLPLTTPSAAAHRTQGGER